MAKVVDMSTDLRTMYKHYLDCARTLKGFQVGQKNDVRYDIQFLANGLCDAIDNKNELDKSRFFSALVIRYWHLIPYYYERRGALNLDESDVLSWIVDGILKACFYRGWRDPKQKVFNDARGAEKCINQCITSIRALAFTYSNRVKNSGKINEIPVSQLVSDIVPEHSYVENLTNYETIIKYLLHKNNLCGALIVHAISQDMSLVNERFSTKKFATLLKENPSFVLNSFNEKKYSDDSHLVKYFNNLVKKNLSSLKRSIKESFNELREDTDLFYSLEQ